MTDGAEAPKDAAKRLQLKEQLRERMRQSIVDQGGYGIRQTALWERAYVRARKFVNRQYPTQATLKKLIGQFDSIQKWKAE